jgi:hypothetical protein
MMFGLLVLIPVAHAETRQVEFRFELSGDPGSEFSGKLPVFSPGLLTVEAEWRLLTPPAGSAATQTTLTLILLRPNGTEAARSSGASPLRFEMQISEQDLGGLGDRERAQWTVKLINSAGEDRKEVTGRLRSTVPITSGTLVDTDFVLLGSTNAKELPLKVSGPGKLTVAADWQTGSASAGSPTPTSLSLILLHPGEDRVYARRQGRSPIRIEQQIAESALDRGIRFVVRIENGSTTRVKGHLTVIFTPGS